jgi:predicted deacylase
MNRVLRAARGLVNPHLARPRLPSTTVRLNWSAMTMMPLDDALSGQTPLPRFSVQVSAPDLRPWRRGDAGVPGFTTRTGPSPGPHVALIALMHGNELAGAIALDRLLRDEFRPLSGALTFGFANLGAFDRFDPARPTASRFVDEDLNRLWEPAVLASARRSLELDRAREMRPLLERADYLLDLHSMLWPSEPLLLCGNTAKGRALATAIGTPPLVVADAGHASGRRLIDFAKFADPSSGNAAVLVEAGQHWEQRTVDLTLASIAGLLRHLGMAETHPALPPPPRAPRPRVAEVTRVVTASTNGFAFTQSFHGGDIVRQRDTLIAFDGDTEIRTPHDDCLLVMPSLRPSRGHTAVRLARILTG